MKKFVILSLLALVVVAGGAGLYHLLAAGGTASPFRTATIARGDLQVTIGATGVVEPEEVIDVGAQVAGKIEFLGKDPRAETDPTFKDKTVDYGSQVEAKTLLAQIDDSVYRAQRNAAQAALQRAKADLDQLKSKREQAEAEWNRAQQLRSVTPISLVPDGVRSGSPTPIKAIADSDYDLAKSNFEVAVANVKVGEAAIEQQKSALEMAETNLGYTVIRSPVKGIIIDRRVNVGQTLVSSLSASSMFLIAKDLRRMQVWASVNEADIGHLKVGMPVTFSVDAFPKEMFKGQVEQIRLNARMEQNVVMYTVVVSADNSNMKLLPYLTADVKFGLDHRKNVLLIPSAALRWVPDPEQIAPDAREQVDVQQAEGHQRDASESPVPLAKATRERGAAGPRRHPSGPPAADNSAPRSKRAPRDPHHDRGRLWVADGQFVRPVDVRLGVTDGTMSEVSGDLVKEGLEVVVGRARPDAVSESKDPFAVNFMRRRSRQQSKD